MRDLLERQHAWSAATPAAAPEPARFQSAAVEDAQSPDSVFRVFLDEVEVHHRKISRSQQPSTSRDVGFNFRYQMRDLLERQCARRSATAAPARSAAHPDAPKLVRAAISMVASTVIDAKRKRSDKFFLLTDAGWRHARDGDKKNKEEEEEQHQKKMKVEEEGGLVILAAATAGAVAGAQPRAPATAADAAAPPATASAPSSSSSSLPMVSSVALLVALLSRPS